MSRVGQLSAQHAQNNNHKRKNNNTESHFLRSMDMYYRLCPNKRVRRASIECAMNMQSFRCNEVQVVEEQNKYNSITGTGSSMPTASPNINQVVTSYHTVIQYMRLNYWTWYFHVLGEPGSDMENSLSAQSAVCR